MKKIITIILLLIISCNGCANRNIVLNENTKSEQVENDSRLNLKETKFEIEEIDGVSFKPYYMTEEGVFGINYIDTEFSDGSINPIANDSLRKISSDGKNNDMGKKVLDFESLPYIVEERNNSEFLYKNYISGEEKILIESNPKDIYSDYIVYQNTSVEKYIIKNSPYAIVINIVEGENGDLTKSISIININTIEKFYLDVKLESNDKTKEAMKIYNEEYFYTGEEGSLFSISQESGAIKKLILNNGKIIEEEYDKIYNNLTEGYLSYGIYSNGKETRIIYDEADRNKQLSQSIYKVSTKEHNKFTNDNKISNYNMNKMLPNGLLFTMINGEAFLAKFDDEGIKLVYKFDFLSDVKSSSDNQIELDIVTNEEGNKILIKLTVKDKNRQVMDEKFKKYEFK